MKEYCSLSHELLRTAFTFPSTKCAGIGDYTFCSRPDGVSDCFSVQKNPYTCSTRHCTEYIILFFFSLMIMCYLPVSCAEYSLPISRHILLTLLDASTGIYIFSGISKHSGILTSTLYSIHF